MKFGFGWSRGLTTRSRSMAISGELKSLIEHTFHPGCISIDTRHVPGFKVICTYELGFRPSDSSCYISVIRH